MFQYTVKFVCGNSDGSVVARGKYWTAINVHNPSHRETAKVRKQFSQALPSEKAGKVTDWFPAELKANESFEIDNADTLKHLGLHVEFAKGFVTIESPTELDVVAVYTTGAEQVQTFFLERAPARKLA